MIYYDLLTTRKLFFVIDTLHYDTFVRINTLIIVEDANRTSVNWTHL